MSERLETLYVVMRGKAVKGSAFFHGTPAPYRLFRTRAAARNYAKARNDATNDFFTVAPVKWGPETQTKRAPK